MRITDGTENPSPPGESHSQTCAESYLYKRARVNDKECPFGFCNSSFLVDAN
jgi:hypothetical protein